MNRSENHRRKGLLRELSDRQLDVQEMLSNSRDTEDKTIEDGLAGSLGYPDELVIAVVLVRLEMMDREEPELMDMIWAGEFLDHLDTQGFSIRHKPRRRN
jgi:hypothetical protein